MSPTLARPNADAAPSHPPEPQVEVYGIRHHGPGSARSLLAALKDYQPDAVLIEGPADADPLLGWAVADDMVPPVALLAYGSDEPGVAAFWPFAAFSPEWQALTWALRNEIAVSFCDLPAALTLASSAEPRRRRGSRPARIDPLAALAAAAGYDDAERWWDDVVESRLDGASPFPALLEAMAELRADELRSGELPGDDPAAEAENHKEARREAHMRQCIRAALKQGRRRIAVVCGAWHAPALTMPLPPASRDLAVLKGAPKRKVTLTWVPWTHERLASASGYGAGVASPGWYHHLWTTPDRPVVRWLTAVAAALRRRDLPVSSAHVIEAVRLADNLAALRDRPLAGLTEVTDATRAVLCEGDELAVQFVTDELVVGQALGSVSDAVPTVPLEADLLAQARRLRIRREASPRLHDLDLRKPTDRDRSTLFHRLRLLDLGWVQPAESGIASRGTFRETWQSFWRPEFAVSLVVASVWGTTVETAAAARMVEVAEGGSLTELTELVEAGLQADLPSALERLLEALAERAAVDADVVHLMEALPALARAQRYGDVRGTDTSALLSVCVALVLRICAGLPQAVSSLDDESAAALRSRVDAVHAAIGLLSPSVATSLRRRWFETLGKLLDRPDVNGELVGRFVRLLFDAELLDDVAVRLHRALSRGVSANAKAAWVDGFFADGALLLIHDDALRGLLLDWVAGLGDEEFVEVLPLVRRTFGTFSPAERRSVADRIAGSTRSRSPAPEDPASEEPAPEDLRPGDERAARERFDRELAAPALATVALLLGHPAPSGGSLP
ncbi:MAG TPA: DUF5682 family protein [Propionibacteriaceae bacterium]|nr:DUF5682 family protein [Propionibacteriaceae bacterium]